VLQIVHGGELARGVALHRQGQFLPGNAQTVILHHEGAPPSLLKEDGNPPPPRVEGVFEKLLHNRGVTLMTSPAATGRPPAPPADESRFSRGPPPPGRSGSFPEPVEHLQGPEGASESPDRGEQLLKHRVLCGVQERERTHSPRAPARDAPGSFRPDGARPKRFRLPTSPGTTRRVSNSRSSSRERGGAPASGMPARRATSMP
jgi:hypothetical protein